MTRSRRWAVVLMVAVGAAAAVPGGASAARGSGRVAALQVALQARGFYTGDIDGFAGPGTRRAVRLLQRDRRLVVDGIAGPTTRRALGRRGRPGYGARAIVTGARGWDVAELQFLLAWRGFPSGPIDGGFGERTKAALLRYQAWAGLAPDGTAGPATLSSLRRPSPRSPLALGAAVAAPVGDRFGPRGNRFHSGVDFTAPAGEPVHAVRSGRVTFAGWNPGGYGRLVVVDHGLGVTTWYAHLSRFDVGPGDPVAQGALLGRVGASGHATGPHLHLEVRLRGAVTDPLSAVSVG